MEYKMSETTQTLNLQSLLVPSKTAEIDFPGKEGFKVQISFLSREELVKIRKKSTKIVYKQRQPVDEFNEDTFLQLYVAATIKGWKGLKFKYLSQFAPVDLSSIKDLEKELEYTPENALTLMKSSSDFDAFITDKATELENFQ